MTKESACVSARRKSGGGTVYHDQGNINFSFITHRQDYNRQYNLNIINDCLNKSYSHLNLKCNSRDDIMQDGCKVSGSAARMTRIKAYHHCTLLVNSDKQHLRSSLRSPFKVVVHQMAENIMTVFKFTI